MASMFSQRLRTLRCTAGDRELQEYTREEKERELGRSALVGALASSHRAASSRQREARSPQVRQKTELHGKFRISP